MLLRSTISPKCVYLLGCVEEDRVGQGRVWQGRVGQGRVGQGRVGQGKGGQGHINWFQSL